MRADFAALGVRVAAPETQDQDDGKIRVFAENWPSLMAFIDCGTQWRTHATPAGLLYLGLDYAAVVAVLGFQKLGREVFDDLRVMELEALGPLNEARG